MKIDRKLNTIFSDVFFIYFSKYHLFDVRNIQVMFQYYFSSNRDRSYRYRLCM